MTPGENGRDRVRRLARVAVLLGFLLSAMEEGQPLAQPDGPDADQQAQRLLAARCAVCHSTDLIWQQRLPRDRWEATVEKMVHWGAQVDQAEAAVLVAYLSTTLHPQAGPVVAPPVMRPSGPVAGAAPAKAGVAARGAELYRQNCLPCHGEAAQGGVGPKLAGNVILTRDAQFSETVRSGRGAMPPWGAVLKPQDIADIQAWLKTL